MARQLVPIRNLNCSLPAVVVLNADPETSVRQSNCRHVHAVLRGNIGERLVSGGVSVVPVVVEDLGLTSDL